MAVIIVSTRVPLTIRHTSTGFDLAESQGGVATGLRAVQEQSGGVWIGWPGPTDNLTAEERIALEGELVRRHFIPVFLQRDEVRGFYQKYAHGVLWPLFHYLPQHLPLRPDAHWEAYERVNRRVVEMVAQHCGPDDEVWIQDYQLMLAPAMLRALRPELRIGYFLHVPFPSWELFRALPHRAALLEGVLGADLIGFHTTEYAVHFAASVTRALGVPVSSEGVLTYAGRTVTTGVFPMGVDVARFEAPAETHSFDLKAGRGPGSEGQTMLAIDRLDYSEGIPRRLLAFERMLLDHPELRGTVTLLQVAVPSRTGGRAYRQHRRQVDALVGRINGAFGSLGWTPVQYLSRGFSQADVVSLYRHADVMLVTPVRDGMNLACKEFVASRTDQDGVLVLSEFTGAAAELTEAVQVNPFDIPSAAAAYYQALTMPLPERRERMRALRARVHAQPVHHWAEMFLRRLRPDRAEGQLGFATRQTTARVLARVNQAESLAILLDYDGTLVPFASHPDLAEPDAGLLQLIESLAARPDTQVHVVSGRQRASLERWLGGLPIGLHAEHGCWSRPPGAQEWRRHPASHPVPYDAILSRLKVATVRVPGSMIERKAAGLAWHFRLADPALGLRQADALVAEVHESFSTDVVDVIRGHMVIEFRPMGVHKGLVVRGVRKKASPGMILALGDDTTDNDMFDALGPSDMAVRVGAGPCAADLHLRDVDACREFLAGIVAGPLDFLAAQPGVSRIA
jgi:trehalose 6-phosphate synthase/phosphatase